MKRRNFNKSIMQKGGLMIEALAMLGLIAVVTPTMYKKSAERTMEVEDINTATTIRTITNAANDYISANYSTLIGDMVKNDETMRTIDLSALEAYLPYGFKTEKALYNYDGSNIKVAIARQGNNLTTLMLFPAKMDANKGIGQERTARIAALIGSSGGYVTDEKKARGIGGIWKLEGSDFTNAFGEANPNTYSIVTASADTISASAGNEMDYTKYLQRGKDAGYQTEDQWKNTMRTDLYMGGPEAANGEDVYREATGPWSIRNIKSLIVGADNAPQTTNENGQTTETGNYGLYIANGADNPNAYIHGSIEAGDGNLKADNSNLQYGKNVSADGTSNFGFSVDTLGSITNLKNLNLATKFTDGWNSIKIGALDDNADDSTNYIIKADHDNTYGEMNILGKVAQFKGSQYNSSQSNRLDITGIKGANTQDSIVLMEDGFKQIMIKNTLTNRPNRPSRPPLATTLPEISYATTQYFPIRLDANTKVDALLATRQLDTQKIRAATLSVGSENIDDTNKWLTADENGVLIKNPKDSGENGSGTYAKFNKNGIFLRMDNEDQLSSNDDIKSAHPVQLNLWQKNEDGTDYAAELYGWNTDIRGRDQVKVSSKGVLIQVNTEMPEYWDSDTIDLTDSVDENTLLLRTRTMEARMKGQELTIKGRQYVDGEAYEAYYPHSHKTTFKNGHVDLDTANLNVVKTDSEGTHTPVFSVRANDKPETDFNFNDNIGEYFTSSERTKNDTLRDGNYDVSVRGKFIIAPQRTTDDDEDNYAANVSVGALNKNAGINIVTKEYQSVPPPSGMEVEKKGYSETSDSYKNIILIDQGATYSSNNSRSKATPTTSGTIGAEPPSSYRAVEDGTIYIRKGYLEVNSANTVSRSTPSTNNAFQGNGVIVASRLVANNSPSSVVNSTDGYGVPQLVTDNELGLYEKNDKTAGKDVKRYDTYMVNPAYTSVMHDIKLTTRGGARLSDILPDFINKGIYIVNNSYKEGLLVPGDSDFAVSKWNTGNELSKDKKMVLNTLSTMGEKDAWASPFLGFVPAPQCPPGYGRVITLTPSSFRMGTAGRLISSKGGDYPYYVLPEQNLDAGQFKAVGDDNTGLKFTRANVVADSNNASMNIKGSVTNSASSSVTVSDISNISLEQYVLTSPELNNGAEYKYLAPLTIQQSDWLKTKTTKIIKINDPKKSKDYVQGWATYMGFLYLKSRYPEELTNGRDHANTAKTLYWNLFPVMQRSLEAYATVYCYFDRTNLFEGRKTGTSYIDELQYMNDPYYTAPPSTYEKAASSNYTNRLNDPSMKYDEVW